MYRAPLLAWAALLLLLTGSVLITALVPGPALITVNLAFAVLMAALIFTVFMGLRGADGLLRVTALGGLLWLFFLSLLTIADFLAR